MHCVRQERVVDYYATMTFSALRNGQLSLAMQAVWQQYALVKMGEG